MLLNKNMSVLQRFPTFALMSPINTSHFPFGYCIHSYLKLLVEVFSERWIGCATWVGRSVRSDCTNGWLRLTTAGDHCYAIADDSQWLQVGSNIFFTTKPIPPLRVYNIALVCGTLIRWEPVAIHVSCKGYRRQWWRTLHWSQGCSVCSGKGVKPAVEYSTVQPLLFSRANRTKNTHMWCTVHTDTQCCTLHWLHYLLFWILCSDCFHCWMLLFCHIFHITFCSS